VKSELYGNGELPLHEERRCTRRGICTRCTERSCVGRKNYQGEKPAPYEEGEL
jgi:hypothetical protein